MTIELTIVAAYSFERSSGIASPRASASLTRANSIRLSSLRRDVLVDRDPVALELVVVAHEPRHVLGRVLARLGLEVAEAAVERNADAALQLGIGGDPLVETRIERLSPSCSKRRRNAWWLIPAERNVTSLLGHADELRRGRATVSCTEWQSPTTCFVGVPL